MKNTETSYKTQKDLLKEVKILQKLNFEDDLIKVKFLDVMEVEKEDFLDDLKNIRRFLENGDLGCNTLGSIYNALGYYKHFYKDYVQNENF